MKKHRKTIPSRSPERRGRIGTLGSTIRLGCFLAMLCIASGCESGPDRPRPIRYITPGPLIDAIASADHIVVTNRLAGRQVSPRVASYSMTITGQEMVKIVHVISSLRTSINNHVDEIPESYKWQLQFYRGTAHLGRADLSDNAVLYNGSEYFSGHSVFYDGWQYHAPWVLRRLYHRAMKESGEDD
jgi:hypothetical protein